MSISLNDHERRIKALENRPAGSYSETVLWSGNSRDTTFTLSQPVTDFKLLCFYNSWTIDRSGPWCTIVPVSLITNNHVDLFAGSDMASSIGRYIRAKASGNKITLSLHDCACVMYKIIGLKIYYIFRYNIYNKFILRINSTFDNFVNIFTSFDLFGSFKRSVLRLTNHFTSQNEFYYLREVNYDMEIKSNILYYKILVLCYILLKQIFVCFSLLVDMEFYFYHFMGGEKI